MACVIALADRCDVYTLQNTATLSFLWAYLLGLKKKSQVSTKCQNPDWFLRVVNLSHEGAGWFLRKNPEQTGAWQIGPRPSLLALVLITSMFTGKCPHLLPAASTTQPRWKPSSKSIACHFADLHWVSARTPRGIWSWLDESQLIKGSGQSISVQIPIKAKFKSPALLFIVAMWAL